MKRRRLAALLGACLLGACSLATAAFVTLRDPRVSVPRQTFTPAQQRTLNTLAARIQAHPAAAPALGWRGGWLDGGAAWLSFTAPFRTLTPERLDVFSLGQTEGLQFLLVLTRPGKREQVWQLEPTDLGNWANYYAPRTIYTARDLNLDGRRELVIEYAGGIGDGGGGQSSTSLLLLDFTAQAPRLWGSLPVSDGASGPGGEVLRQAAYVVQVEKGKTPRFQGLFLKTLSKPFAEREQYAATGKVVPLKLDPSPSFKLTRLW